MRERRLKGNSNTIKVKGLNYDKHRETQRHFNSQGLSKSSLKGRKMGNLISLIHP